MKNPFARKRKLLEPVYFMPVEKAFSPQVQIHTHQTITGWVKGKEDRARYTLDANKVYAIDEELARKFVARGYASFVTPQPPISDDERSEAQGVNTTLSLGA